MNTKTTKNTEGSLKDIVGANLSRLRGYLRLTREQMAAYLGVHPATITNYEHGHVLMQMVPFTRLQNAGINGLFIMGDSEDILREGFKYDRVRRFMLGERDI